MLFEKPNLSNLSSTVGELWCVLIKLECLLLLINMSTFAWGWVGDEDTLFEFLLIWCDMRFDEFNPTAKNIWELLHVL